MMPLHSDHSRSRPSIGSLFFLGLVLALAGPAAAWSTEPTPPVHAEVVAGHSGMWYDPSRSGEGWMLEVRPNDEAVVYWFTFDDQGNPRWLNGVGQVHRGANGDEIRFDDLIAVHGPRFGPDYDREDAVIEHVGQARFRFLNCDHGEVEFDAYGQQGSFPLVHLTHTMGAKGCRPIHGTPGEPVQAYAGQSGSWYDPTYSGQGFTLGWMPNGDAALVWFTFDAHGQPYWLTGVGTPEEDRIVFDQLLSVRGGRFAEDFDPATVTRTPWGRMELTLECEVGQAHYVPTEAGFAEGQFNLHRLTRLESPDCPWVKPKLTDLYDLEWTELPIPPAISPLPHDNVNFKMHSIADDGTVVGRAYWYGWAGIVRLRPGETEWEKMLANDPAANGGTGAQTYISPDGKVIYAQRDVPPLPEAENNLRFQMWEWQEPTGWRPLPGVIYYSNVLYGMSQNGKWLVGKGYHINDGRSFPWKWSAETGQMTLDDWATPMGISNDGNIAVGTLFLGTRWATLWRRGKMQFLYENTDIRLGVARVCNGDCSLMAGFYQYPQNTWPESYLAWYRTGSGAVTYLEMPEGAEDNNVVDMSRNGDLIAGIQAVWEESRAQFILEGWLWTQDTGSVSFRDILEGEGEFQFTNRWERQVMDVSSDGTRILFTGYTLPTRNSMTQYRAGVLRLIPKASQDAVHQSQE